MFSRAGSTSSGWCLVFHSLDVMNTSSRPMTWFSEKSQHEESLAEISTRALLKLNLFITKSNQKWPFCISSVVHFIVVVLGKRAGLRSLFYSMLGKEL